MMTDQRHPNCLPIEEENRRRELHRQGLDDRAMAKAVGISYGAMAHWRWKNGLKPNKPKRRPPKPKNAKSIANTYPRANRLFMQAFERDLVAMTDRHKDWKPNIDAFIRAWRDSRANEVIAEIERGSA